MGGIGSGRRISLDKKLTTESQHRVDIRWLNQRGLLVPGYAGSLYWRSHGRETGRINYYMESDRMILKYRQRFNGGNWEEVELAVLFDWTQCYYGGTRKWFLCPGCGRRIAVIYGAGRLFLCRHCHGLCYASQQEAWPERNLRKARKIKERLGASDPFQSNISRPKGMHRRTFLDLRIQAVKHEWLGWAEMARKAGLSEYLGFPKL